MELTLCLAEQRDRKNPSVSWRCPAPKSSEPYQDFQISHMFCVKTFGLKKKKKSWCGTSLVVQWLRLHAPKAGGPGSIHGQETRSHILQLRPVQPNKYLKQNKNKTSVTNGLSGGSAVKNLPVSAREAGLVPGSGKSPAEGNGNPVQYSCLENSMHRGAWWAIQSIGSHTPGHACACTHTNVYKPHSALGRAATT